MMVGFNTSRVVATVSPSFETMSACIGTPQGSLPSIEMLMNCGIGENCPGFWGGKYGADTSFTLAV